MNRREALATIAALAVGGKIPAPKQPTSLQDVINVMFHAAKLDREETPLTPMFPKSYRLYRRQAIRLRPGNSSDTVVVDRL